MSDIEEVKEEEVKELKDSDFKEYIKKHVHIKVYRALKDETVKKQGKEKKTHLKAHRALVETDSGEMYEVDDDILSRDYMEVL